MDIDALIDTFRREHPELDAALLREFADHVCRVVTNEVRADVKEGAAQVSMSMQVHGMAFSAKGPRYFVEELFERWQDRVNRKQNGLPPSGFNRMQIISGRGR